MKNTQQKITKITGLIGWPVEHSLSPTMHTAGFKKLGLNFNYELFPVEPKNLKKFLGQLKKRNFRGVNVTIPHKEKVMPILDKITEPARMIGAVNTIINEGGRLIGHNTDGPGFIEFLKKEARFNPENKIVTILGAGGAARAVSFMLVKSGAKKIFLFDVVQKKSQKLKNDLNQRFGRKTKIIKTRDDFSKILKATHLLINATPIGLWPDTEQIPLEREFFDFLARRTLVIDLIYNPARTRFLKEAQKRKLKNFNGLGLLVWQGILAFKLFTGRPIKPLVFWQALKKYGKRH